jgi:hypothetical protein
MNESERPDWLADLATGGEARWRPMELLVQGIVQLARTGWPKTVSLALSASLRLAAAVDAEVRVLKLTPPPVCAWVPQAKEISIVSPALVVRGGSLAPPRIGAVAQGTAGDRRHGLAALSDGEIVFLVLVWLYAVWLPWFGSRLPPEFHGMLSDSLATFAIALSITWRIRDKHK